MKLLVIVLFWLVSHPTLAAGTCSVEDLTKKCEFFNSVKEEDTLEFAGGFTIPACALSSIDKVNRDADDEAVKLYDARIADFLNRAPPGAIHEDRIEDLLNSNELDKLFRMKNPQEMRWPPGAQYEKQKRITVTPAEYRAYFDELLGADTVTEMIAEMKREGERRTASFGKRFNKPQYVFDRETVNRKERLFAQSKAALERYLLRGRDPGRLSEAEKNILARVQSVALRSSMGGSADCGPAHTSFYDYSIGEAGFPPSMMFHTDESLVRAMVHELAHSVDHCRLSQAQQAGGSQPAIPPGENPFLPVHQCLLRERGEAFAAISDTDPLSSANACEHNKHLEGFCDWMATEVMAQEIKEGRLGRPSSIAMRTLQPPSSGRKTVKVPKGWEAIFYQLDLACSEDPPNRFVRHPQWADRLDHILLRKPEIREALGCDPASADPGCRLPASNVIPQKQQTTPATTR